MWTGREVQRVSEARYERRRGLSKVKRIQDLVRDGLYYLTEHADDEATAEGFDIYIYDVEHGILTGRIRRTWPKEGTYEVIGVSIDG